MGNEKHIVVHEAHETTHLSNKELRQHHERLERARHEQAKNKMESDGELKEARTAIAQEALRSDEVQTTHSERPTTEKHTTREDKAHAFRSVMHHVRKDLSAPERTFSKVIHQPAVEKASDIASKTVARPSGVIGATAAAAAGLLIIYGIARFAGFQLSGSEMPLLLAIGFVGGLLVEWAYKAVRSILLTARG